MLTRLFGEGAAVAAVIPPGNRVAGAVNSSWIDLAGYYQLAAIIATGTLGASATLDGKWQLADDGSGTNTVDAPSTALTQILKAAGDNKQAIHTLDPNQLTLRTKRFVRYVLTVGTAASDCAVVILGLQPRSIPVTQPATVVQPVAA